jgi:tetratricopeptide (TPR) repeat protein
MAHSGHGRYKSALQLAEDMECYLAGAPVSAYRESLPARAWRWCKRHRRAVGWSVGVAVVLGLALLGAALVYDARTQAEVLRHETALLERKDKARDDLHQFQRLASERHNYAASTTPAGVSKLYYKSRRGEAAAREALEIADRLGPELAELELEQERGVFGKELHDLLLLMVQDQGQESLARDKAAEMRAHLERAASPRGPSRSYHRLLGQCCRLLGEKDRADEEARHAEQVPSTALDHFLEAEEFRAKAGNPAHRAPDDFAWQPDTDLLREAVKHYQQALQTEPANFWCHFQLGRCYLSLGQGSEVLEALNVCVALQPAEVPWGYSARGLALGLTRQYAEGDADLNKALEIDPHFHPALLHRGLLAWLQRKDNGALQDFKTLLELPAEERLIEAAYYRGQLHVQRKEFEQARDDFDLVVKDNPRFRPVYLSRAQLYFLGGDELRGLGDLTTFLDLARPKPFAARDPLLFVHRGRLLRHLVPDWGLSPEGSFAALKLARGQFEQAIKLGHRSAETLDDLGSVAELLVEPENGVLLYEQALRTAPRDLAVKIHCKRGLLYAQSLRQPRFDRAREDFEAALQLDPHNAEAHAGLGYVLALQRTPEEAEREAARALIRGTGDYMNLHNVACIYAELSRVEKSHTKRHQDRAVDLIRQALAMWRRGGRGPSEVDYIKNEPAFKVLLDHPDFQDLLKGESH